MLKIRRAALALVAAGGLAVGGTGIAQETAAGNPENAILDGTFQGSGKPAGEYLISANSAMGSWKVELGNVGLHIGQYATPVEDAAVIDLNGYRSGSLYQSVTTVPGQTYTVKFHATGNWRTMPWMPRKLSLRFGNEAVSYTVTKPEGWSAENPGWQEYTATFVAQHSKTAVRFSSGSSRIPDGALITNVQLLPPVRLGPDALDTIEVPLPSNLDEFVRDRDLAVVLGKALFWDMQVGSDNRTACATCHWNAGADTRDVNTLHPGATGGIFGQQLAAGKAIELQAQADFRGVNKKLRRQDFPFHQLETPLFPGDEAGFESSENPVVFSTREITGSTGIGEQNFVGLSGCCAVELTYSNQNSLFKIGGKNSRQVTTRNTPSTINAVFFDRTFWDGRASHYFNGVNPFGDLDPDAKVYREAADGRLEKVSVLLDNATLASQAVGPVLSSIEMSAQGRLFSDVARKLFATRPLAMQRVSSNDSVLGEYADAGGYGLHQHKAGYATLIRRAFLPEWWASPDYTEDGYTHMEANFSLFWGLSVMLYEATLVSDESPYDQYARGDYKAMSAAAVEGLRIFVEEGKCISCHHGPEFAGATVSALRNHAADELDPENPVDQMDMKNGEFASYDSGFYNIGVRPTVEDIGIGALHPYLGPLSYTRQEQLGKDPDPAVTVGKDDRVAVMGAFKTPTLRNVELTGPYMHNGGMKSLTEVVEFYVRGGNFPKTNAADLHPDIGEISELQENPQAVSYLVEFLMHLTDERVRYQAAPFDHPELYLPLGHAGVEYGKLLDHIVVLPATGRDGGGRLHSFEETLYGQVSWKNPGRAYPPADPYEDKPVEEYPPADPYEGKPVE
ncbi:MAG: cytochrome-c peroxidase, partial [Planctomycetaceae bacterium]